MSKVKGWTRVAQPYSDGYYQREHRAMRALRPHADGDVVLERKTAEGRLDGYLYKDFGTWEDIPVLKIGRDTWMSITPMEVQSHYMPLSIAEGRVGVGGLGLGYAVQRMLTKPDVDRVACYERDERVIALYRRHFGDHPKLTLVHADVREVEGEAFDFFYMDVYPHIADEAIWRDWAQFIQCNSVEQYHPWGIEAFLLAFAGRGRFGEVPFWMRHQYGPFLRSLTKAGKVVEPVWMWCPPEETLAEWRSTRLAAEWGL